jgi:hypothetical protein
LLYIKMTVNEITTEGWYLYSVNASMDFETAKTYWGILAGSDVYRYIYELKFGTANGMPITAGNSLTSDNWLQIDTNSNPTLEPFKAYWVLVTSTGDTTAPLITLIGNATVYHKLGEVYNDAGATAQDDVDGVVAVTNDSASVVDTSVEGAYTVTYTASDAADNTATAERIVIVDGTAPVITVAGDDPVAVAHNASYTDAGATAQDAVDGTVTVTDNSNLVDTSVADATYTVTYIATDSAGNQATATRTVNIGSADSLAPVITLIGNATVYHKLGEVYNDAGATAQDAVDGVVAVTNDSASVVDTSVEGAYTVTYIASDAVDNTATAERIVIVDGTAPVITVAGDDPVAVAHNASYTDAGATAQDAVDGTVTVTDNSNLVDTSVAEANYTVTYTATDRAGNTATATRTVNIGPAAAGVSSNLVISSAAGTQGATTNYIVHQLSWEWSDVSTLTSGNLLSTSFNTESGDLSDVYIDSFNTDIKAIPNSAFFGMVPSLAETTYLSCGTIAPTYLMDSGASIPDPTVLNDITTDALIWSTAGLVLSNNTPIQIAQLTFSNTTNGTFRIRYADSQHGDYQSIILTVTNGELSQ